MSLFCLHISDEQFTIEDIYSWNGIHKNIHTNQVLVYCKAWLEGKNIFELKTSGSTGVPKTISIHRNQIEASTKATLDFFDLKNGDAVSCPLSIETVGGQMMLYRSIIGGLQLYIIPPSKELALLDTFVTYAFMPISAIQLFEVLTTQPEKIKALNKLKNLLIGGSSLSNSLLEQIKNKLTCTVWQSYGMTETVSHIAMRRIHPITESSYTVLDNISVGIDERSCLKIEGTITHNEWIQTNDCVELLDAIHFNYLGRADFTVNSGGIKIQVEPIERMIDALFTELGITSAFFVGGITDDALGEKVILVMDSTHIDKEKKDFILMKLADKLPKYHAPKDIYTLSFEHTSSGKVDRKRTIAKIQL